MKCPYRIEKSIANNGSYIEDYAECYGDECPFYEPERHWNNDLVTLETCSRPITNKTIKDLLKDLREGEQK